MTAPLARVLCALGAILVLGSCSTAPGAVVRFELPAGSFEVRAEVARSPEEMARGLMGRTSLAPDTGMLFVWDHVAERTFWMKDTLIALDLIVIRDGVVVSVQQMDPCEADPCPLTSTPPADSALEVAAGTAARAGIGPGARVAVSGSS